MRRSAILLLISIGLLSFSLGYDPGVSVASSLGSIFGAYVGENVAVPVLIAAGKLGIIDEGEIFSPFSTLMYDAMDTGRIMGAVLAGLTIKYAFFQEFNPATLVLDTALALSTLKISEILFGGNRIISSVAVGISLGIAW